MQLSWNLVKSLWATALLDGNVEFNIGHVDLIPDGGIPFELHTCVTLGARTAYDVSRPPVFNPFLPYDRRQAVMEMPDEDGDHVLLFNKFAVVPHHLLLITKDFESQEAQLRLATMRAAHHVMTELAEEEVDWVVFFNCGPVSGASQRHKHIQLIPMAKGSIPLESVLEDTEGSIIPAYAGFKHAIARMDRFDPESAYQHYQSLMSALSEPPAYNLVWTRCWMFLVPRSQAGTNGLAFNALAFFGLFTVKSEEERERFLAQSDGPIQFLSQLAYSKIN